MKHLIVNLRLILFLTSLAVLPLNAQNIPDFRVNEIAGGDGSEQTSPFVGGDGNGNYVITWQDERNGSNLDIFAQIFLNNGAPFGNNFRVNDDTVYATQYRPAIAVEEDMSFVIAWVDDRDGNWDIYAQHLSGNGSFIGTNFRVNDEQGEADQEHPSVVMDGSGNFVIVWADKRNGNWDIYTQRYSFDGATLGNNFKVNDDVFGTSVQYFPAVSGDQNGNFVTVWDDAREGDYDIYMQRYLADGTTIGNNIRVNDNTGGSFQLIPDVSVDGNSNWIVVWTDQRNNEYDIYAQQYLADGTALGTNFMINDDQPGISQANASVSADAAGNFVVTWEDDREGIMDIYAQRFLFGGITVGDNFRVNDNILSAYHYSTEVFTDNPGSFIIVWEDYRNGSNGDIYMQSYLDSGLPNGINGKVNDDPGSENQETPSITVDGNNNFVIAWCDYRNGDEDIYCQRFSGDGTPMGFNFRVNDNTEATVQEDPSIAAAEGGNYVITWGDVRDGYVHDIYAQLFNVDGTPIGPNFKVNYLGAYMHYSPAVACAANGDFIITWWDTNDGGMMNDYKKYKTKPPFQPDDFKNVKSREGADIWAQRYLNDGTPVGTNFKVNEDQGDFFHAYPSIAADPDGNFIIAWEDDRNGDYDIYLQRFLADGTPVGSNIRVEDPVFSQYQWLPVVTIDEDGNFVVAWCDFRNGNYDIFAQRYKNDGTPVGCNFQVNSFGGSGFYLSPGISSDNNGDFIIGWTDKHTDTWDVYAQRFTEDGMTTGDNYRISMAGEMDQFNPAMALMNGRIFSAWQDNRGGQTGFDVWANVVEWSNWLGTKENFGSEQQLTNGICLYQNFPNPFHSFTRITYTVTEPGEIMLDIYDKLGRQVKALINQFQVPATYSVEVNGTDMIPGLYYIGMKIGNETREIKKMVIAR